MTNDATPATPKETPQRQGKRGSRWRQAFLASLQQNANVRAACEGAGINRTTAYRERWRDLDFAAAWDDAVEEGCDRLEEALFKRAVDGVKKTVFYRDVAIGEETSYSDTAAIFLLKGHRPQKYADRIDSRHTGPGGGPIQHAHPGQVDLRLLTDDELRTLDETYDAALARAGQNGAGEKAPA
jgi:hypothetical protein